MVPVLTFIRTVRDCSHALHSVGESKRENTRSGERGCVSLIFCIIFLAALPSALADDRASGLVVESMTTVLIRQTEIPAREAGVLKALLVAPGEHVNEG